ncbi:MAG: flagellar hook-basal body protein [Bacteroidota bacterium]
MDFTLDELKSAMLIQTKKNDIVSNNLANVNTIGFKKDYTFFDAYEKKMAKVNNLSIQTVKDFSQGEFEDTNNPLDFAISGDGFFNIDADGETVYTRNGHFELNDEGYLVDNQGNYVLGENGRINLQTNFETVNNIFVNGEGEIYVDNILADQFKLSGFNDNAQVERLSGSVFRLKNPDAVSEQQSDAVVVQGKIEQSNVNPVKEMVNLIELQRGFESSQRTIRILDEALSKASTQISRV